MLVLFQLAGSAGTPLNATVLPTCVGPKLVPLTVIEVPTAPELGDIFVAPGETVKFAPYAESTVTITGPVVAPTGTGTIIDSVPQLVGVAVTPLNETVLAPCVSPKVSPEGELIVT